MADENAIQEALSGPQSDEQGSQAQEPTSPNAEAAKWRTRLRETEAERDSLTDQLGSLNSRIDAAQKQIADSVISDVVKPDDFWLLGDTVADFRDENGDLDTERLRERAEEVLRERPHFGAKRFYATAVGGPRGSAPAGEKPSFASLFKR